MKKCRAIALAAVLALSLSANALAMELSIQSVTGRSFTVEVDPTDSIEYIKQKIDDAENYPTDTQRLVYKGMALEGWKSLQEYALPADATVDLIMKIDPLDLVGISANGVGKKPRDDKELERRQFWDDVRLQIDNALEGTTITPEADPILSGGEDLPYFVITALYGRDVNLELDTFLLGPLTIQGKDIKSVDTSVISYTVEQVYKIFG